MANPEAQQRVVSGMRPTGRLHLGHYHGVLSNWVRLQHEYECFFFVADWHALTTEYDHPYEIESHVWETVIDWLAAGVNPGSATLFVQSRVPEHAELHLLLSMITPLGWLERVPSFKDQQLKLKEKDLATFGFLGYPLLQSADILMYRGGRVPVGADQIPHVELTREIARRFNHIYGREPGFEAQAEAAVKKMSKRAGRQYADLRTAFLERGDDAALERARALLEAQQNLSIGDRERLFGYLEGGGKQILEEPETLLTEAPRVPGLDGEKMSKSYGNTINLRDDDATVAQKIRPMKTDPARVRRRDPGTPEKCPVWDLHRLYSDADTRQWAHHGCTTAGIGCIDCKGPVIEAVQAEQREMRERARPYVEEPDLVQSLIIDGSEVARDVAKATLEDVRAAMGLAYR